MATRAQLNTSINALIAGASSITAAEHRQANAEIVDYAEDIAGIPEPNPLTDGASIPLDAAKKYNHVLGFGSVIAERSINISNFGLGKPILIHFTNANGQVLVFPAGSIYVLAGYGVLTDGKLTLPSGTPGRVDVQLQLIENGVVKVGVIDYRAGADYLTEAEGNTLYSAIGHNHDAAYIRKTTSPSAISTLWSGTQAQYDAITTKDAATLYFIQ